MLTQTLKANPKMLTITRGDCHRAEMPLHSWNASLLDEDPMAVPVTTPLSTCYLSPFPHYMVLK